MALDANRCIEALDLRPHPEGGYYREIHRSSQQVQADGRTRSAGTSIYFLLPEGAFSAWHVVQSDEQWHHYAGAVLELTLLSESAPQIHKLGDKIFDGEVPQAMVPAGVIQAARPIAGAALVGCTVAPGFDFEDFAMINREDLFRTYPAHKKTIDLFF